MSGRVPHLASLAMAGGAIGGLGAGFVTGSAVTLLVAVFCAVNAVLLRGLALSREVGGRFDDILGRARPCLRPSSDAGGR